MKTTEPTHSPELSLITMPQDIDNKQFRELVKSLVETRVDTHDKDKTVWVVNKLEYESILTSDGNRKSELKIRPYIAVTINQGKIKISHLYNKTSLSLAIVGALGVISLALLLRRFFTQLDKPLH